MTFTIISFSESLGFSTRRSIAMATAVSFDEIIQADRQRKKNEELANRLLGKSKKAVDSEASNKAAPKSLASRIGVVKRSASATRSKQRNNTPRSASAKRRPGEERLAAALDPSRGQAAVRNNAVGMTIKGSSGLGPFVVTGSNFAPGTTAADIQSAVEPTSGPMLSCRVISPRPTVTAEMVFAERWTAETVVANFHNQRADGRVLSVRLEPNGAGANRDSDLFGAPLAPSNFKSSQPSYDVLREQADRQRRNRRTEPELQDGRYGFSNNRKALNNGRDRRAAGSKQKEPETGLYSDQMMVDAAPQQPSGNRGRRQR